MRIDSGNIGMDSARAYTSTTTKARSFFVSVNESSKPEKELSLKEQIQKLKEEYINLLIRLLFPEKEFNLSSQNGGIFNTSSGNSFGYSESYCYEEIEYTEFSAEGTVKCTDGREIDFNINLMMSRSFTEYYSTDILALEQSLTDPLVINFDCDVPELSDQTFVFDIDSDGKLDEMNRLGKGSGFLALDLNNDGIINDGGELFGTRSGNGFKDLEIYDTDKDGFIDEDDEVFDKLKIMCINDDGTKTLYSFKDKNIGAICLMNAPTQFSLNSLTDNQTRGIIRSTGMFLYETGEAGFVHQMDMAVKAYA